MTDNISPPLPIQRSFRELSEAELKNAEKTLLLARLGYLKGFEWDELLHSYRVLLIAEAGAGKTFECEARQKLLWNAGEPAFLLDLATLATSPLSEMLSPEEEERFAAWLCSQSDVATFFLDSIDELKLSLGKFDQALKRLNKAIAGHLGRARIVITTRPISVDRELIKRHLPIPEAAETKATAEDFAEAIMERKKKPRSKTALKAWRNVALMPLSPKQMRDFIVLQGVSDPDALLADIRRRDAEEFVQRPQDLIEICADWREHQRLRTHSDQVKTNIVTKLKPSTKRKERVPLSIDKAIDGASRLALAAMLTRKLTLRHSAEADIVHVSEAALDVSRILTDWSHDEQTTLLERSLFGFATYGRVRFHHQSVLEYLAAYRFEALLARGVPVRSVKRFLFTETAQGLQIVRPSMRPVAAWLALWRDTVFDQIVATDPAILLNEGDPQSLRPAQRVRALEAYVVRYGSGGWRGLSTPRIQVHRFASPELSDPVKQLWHRKIENPEVCELVLEIIAAGKLEACADIAHEVLWDSSKTFRERSIAVCALQRLNDPRLEALALSLETEPAKWPDILTRHMVLDLFPTYLPVSRLSRILGRICENPKSVGDLNYELPRKIEAVDLSRDNLDELRQSLTELIAQEARLDRQGSPYLSTKRPDLIPALIAACHRQCVEGIRTEAWAMSSLLAIRLAAKDHTENEPLKRLRSALADLPSRVRETVFWKEDAFLEGVRPHKDPWHRVFGLSHYGGIQLTAEKDAAWVRKRLADPSEPLDRREMMLWAEMTSLIRTEPYAPEFLEILKQFVSDAPSLVAIIDNRLRTTPSSAFEQLEAKNAKQEKQIERRTAKAYASWVIFWREIAKNSDAVFASKHAENTAWNLWQAMERSGPESRASGWNRRFIEFQFGKDVADRLRQAMLPIWRKDKPTLCSERPDGEKNTFLVRWQFGLAAIAAEAEDPDWAKALSEAEAELACRYVPIELNGFPSWLEAVVLAHPASVDRILGEELSRSLQETAETSASSISLQDIGHASPVVAVLFVPRIRAWLTETTDTEPNPNHQGLERNLSQAVKILMRLGTDDDRQIITQIARAKLTKGLAVPFAAVWLSALLQLSPEAGIEALQNGLKDSVISCNGSGVEWFARLFGRGHGEYKVDVTTPVFTPQLLLRLTRLAYQHVRVKDDVHHEGTYSPDTRDDAEGARNVIVNALFDTTGVEGWFAKLAMAKDPLFSHFKDRAIALAQEKTAEEADGTSLSEVEFSLLDKYGESPPSTRDAMFALMRDRLDDIDDLLLQDVSPREAWASIQDEKVLRRCLAHELRNRANNLYTVDQEAITADEKETDIRLRASTSPQQATIELKIGEKDRSAAKLRAALKDQLLTKYMAAEECRTGCLVVSIASDDRSWKHPDTGARLDFEGLIALLKEEADQLSWDLGGAAKLTAKGLDLRPRLKAENAKLAAT